MSQRVSRQNVMVESLEGRRLFSANLGPVKADLAQLATDATTLKASVNTAVTNLAAGAPAGTAGRESLLTHIKQIRIDLAAGQVLLSDDFTNLKDAINSSSPNSQHLLNKLITEVMITRTTLESDKVALGNDLIKHPALTPDDTHLPADSAAVKTDAGAVKADLKQLKADLAGVLFTVRASAITPTTTFAGVIENTGGPVGLIQTAGSLVLTGANTYTGVTTVSGGFLQLGAGGTSGSVTGAISDASSLVINRLDTAGFTFANNVSGGGSVSNVGSGSVTFTGDDLIDPAARIQLI